MTREPMAERPPPSADGKPGGLFDSSLILEETHLEEGYKEGYSDGLASGEKEGRQVGLKHGFVAGEELGFYRGCVDAWESAIGVNPDAFSERVRRGVSKLGDLLEKYPLMDPENDALQEMMVAMRSKFRLVTAGMGVGIGYGGYLQEEKWIDF